MIVHVIRPARYNYEQAGISLYDSYAMLANGDQKVALTINKNELQKIKQVFGIQPPTLILSGTLLRNIETALLLSSLFPVPLVKTALANEIQYTMEQVLSKQDFEKQGKQATDYARRQFVQKLVQSRLNESFEEMVLRAEKLLNSIEHHKPSSILLVSNSFFMKVLEFVVDYRGRNNEIVSSNFSKFYDGNKQAYDFLDGFSFRIEKGIIYREEVI